MARTGIMYGAVAAILALGIGWCAYATDILQADLLDSARGDNWPGYGRTYGEQHYSPLNEINSANVAKLGLAWSMDLGTANSATVPIAINGVVYFASGLSVVHAIDGASGKLLWMHDTKVAEVAGDRMRQGWGSRGIASWNGKIYTGTPDGRLIALDAKTGRELWSQQTLEEGDLRYITGAPRVFEGKVIIGNAGADSSNTRGYVTTYDAETGKLLWRFFIVPGDPAKGFESPAMEMAAKTWTGEWWKYGGGGHAWNAFSYDPETRTVFVGTGNGAPWNRHVRSPQGGDNLFLCSIVALDADTGAYKWHYQINPGETWDYNAVMDMELADLTIDGHPRKVLMTAPKNGFFYVIDRITGKLISAEKIAKVTWASKIDLETGRPVEAPDARFPNGQTFRMWPGQNGAHSWMPMAYNLKTGLVYIPVNEMGFLMNDKNIDPSSWRRRAGAAYDGAMSATLDEGDPLMATSRLLAWNPVTQKEAWRVPTPYMFNGGILTTAGNLVFQGQADKAFKAYAADTGKLLWNFPAQAAIVGAPISYTVKGRQYVTVLTGMGASGAMLGKYLGGAIDSRSQARRVLTFALNGQRKLPARQDARVVPVEDPEFRPNAALANRGAEIFGASCAVCHGFEAISGGFAPDLRMSQIPLSADAFAAVVRDGALTPNGMPRFHELDDATLDAIRQYIRSETDKMRRSTASKG